MQIIELKCAYPQHSQKSAKSQKKLLLSFYSINDNLVFTNTESTKKMRNILSSPKNYTFSSRPNNVLGLRNAKLANKMRDKLYGTYSKFWT